MKVLIIYESAFGNTEKLALAMRDALIECHEVRAIRPGDYNSSFLIGLDLLVVGSPTQKFSPLKEITDFLKALPEKSLAGIKVAAFDTRIDLKKVNNKVLNFFVFFFGYAAKTIARKLVGKGGTLASPPEGFFVEGTNGPITPGELKRAVTWAKTINA